MSEDRNSVRMLLQKSTRPTATEPVSADQPESDYSAYAQGRISRHSQQTLMFYFADGSVKAISYSCFLGAEATDPAVGCVLDFGSARVKITGRQLEQLLRLTCQHRVAEIREASRTTSFSLSEDSPLVEKLEMLATQ